jgi:hypothetical protein
LLFRVDWPGEGGKYYGEWRAKARGERVGGLPQAALDGNATKTIRLLRAHPALVSVETSRLKSRFCPGKPGNSWLVKFLLQRMVTNPCGRD